MTSPLVRLRDAIVAGEASTMLFEAAGDDGWGELAYQGSVDAALAFKDALLPGWRLSGLYQKKDGTWHAGLVGPGPLGSYAEADTPAIALLLACLAALIEKETT